MSKTAREVLIEADSYIPGGQNEGEGVADVILQRLDAAGFVIAPKEPTEQMHNAGKEAIWQSGIAEDQLGSDALTAADVYRAMIAAAQSR